jgi:tetratricopeptide (TPR) repeat protein
MLYGLNRRTILWHIAIVLAVVVCLYARVTKNDFVDLDDTSIIVENYPFIKDMGNAPQAFKQGIFQVAGKLDTEKTYYRPVVELSFMLDANLFPTKGSENISAKPFLRSNIFYHLLACILLLILLNGLNVSSTASLLLTLLFAVHPILLQAIAWIPGRNDSLVTIFILASMLMLIQSFQSGKRYLLQLHCLFFCLALFTKESALALPIMALAYLYVFRRHEADWRIYALILGGYVLAIGFWFFLRQHALTSGATAPMSEMIKNVFSNAPMFFQYIGKSVIPYGLAVMSTIKDTNYIVGIAAIILIAAGIFLGKEKRMPVIIFGLLWFFIFLIPSFLTFFTGLEHRDYLPLIGLLIVISEFDFVKKLQFNFSSPANTRALIATIALIVVFAGVTFSREPVFKNAYNFDKNAIETSPHATLPCLYMAKHYEEVNNFQKAIDMYTLALQRDSDSYMVHNSMGRDYTVLNKLNEAEAEFKMELQAHPKNTLALFNLGLYNLNNGKDSAAEALGKQSIAIDPQFVDGYKLLAAIWIQKGDTVKAKPYIKWLRDKGIEFPPKPQ